MTKKPKNNNQTKTQILKSSSEKEIVGKKKISMTRSSAAEYLTFIAASGDSKSSVEMRYENENIWLTQKMMATLYNVSISAINQHLKRIFSDNELEREATIKKYLIVQTEGNRQNLATKYQHAHLCNLEREGVAGNFSCKELLYNRQIRSTT